MPGFYALEIFNPPFANGHQYFGFVFNNLDEIKASLDETLGRQEELWVLLCREEQVRLSVYQDAKPVQQIDLRPFIRVRITGQPDISFDRNGQITGFDFKRDDEEHVEEERLSFRLFDERIDPSQIQAQIDWTAAQIPPLQAPILDAGEWPTIVSSYLEREIEVAYGFFDLSDE